MRMNLDKKPVYVVITPVRNEEKYIGKTIDAMVAQTILPTEWIIVNDGSTDKTADIVAEAAKKNSWIHLIYKENRGFRKAGGGVIEAFNLGYSQCRTEEFDYIVKLDGDLSFEATYFERCFSHFDINPKLGVGGGVILNLINGELIEEKHPLFHVRGATKIYSSRIWGSLGGLLMVHGWDTLDEIKSNMLGFESKSFPELKLVHYRVTGGADGSWKSAINYGIADYICGYHPLFLIVKCVRRITMKPIFFNVIGHLWGFFSSYIKHIPQVDDKDLIRYVRKQQINRLLFRKSIW